MRNRYDRSSVPPPVRIEPFGLLLAAAAQDKLRPNGRSRDARIPIATLLAAALGGCVTVEAPERPIVIELNVNIRQEVIYRLAADARNTVESNRDIF